MKYLLETAYQTVGRKGFQPNSPAGFREMLADSKGYEFYVESLSEGLTEDSARDFKYIAETTRGMLMENSMFQLNPYETLTLPVLRVFYPKLVAKELVNIMPIDKPDVIKGFIRASFKKFGDPGFIHQFPSMTNISQGPQLGVESTAEITLTEGNDTYDLLVQMNLDSSQAHLEKDFRITGVYDASSETLHPVTIIPTVDGVFSEKVTLGEEVDTISGHVNYLDGTITFSSAKELVSKVRYQVTASLEENLINPTTKYDIEKIPFKVIDRRIQAEWSLNFEQDVRALWNIEVQSDIVNTIGEQIALDIDNHIIRDLIQKNAAHNPDSHNPTFVTTPPETFTWGEKAWYENIVPVLNRLSAQVYNSSLMGAANTIACNPLDAAIFESLNSFAYAGNSVEGGDVGYRTATVGSGKWKILVSTVIPEGKAIVKYRSSEMMRAVYVYAPYVPAVLSPYPLGPNPSLSIMTRYASRMIRPEGVAVLNITDEE